VVIVELGANDALRGLDPGQAKSNLDAILAKLRPSTAPCCWPGCWRPAIWGPTTSMPSMPSIPISPSLRHCLYPFFLEGVAADPTLNQADGLHPTAAGVAIIVRGILPALRQVIAKAGTPS
jgi:Lysophospholipase L1 and related esterases